MEESKPLKERFDEKTLKRADFCMNKCPICKGGREKGRGLFYQMTKLEAKTKLCPYCNAYKKVYGVPSYEKPHAR